MPAVTVALNPTRTHSRDAVFRPPGRDCSGLGFGLCRVDVDVTTPMRRLDTIAVLTGRYAAAVKARILLWAYTSRAHSLLPANLFAVSSKPLLGSSIAMPGRPRPLSSPASLYAMGYKGQA